MSRFEDLINSVLPDLERSNRDSLRVKLAGPLELREEDVREVANIIRDLPLKLREDIKSEIFEADLRRYDDGRYYGERSNRVQRYSLLDQWYTKAIQETG